MSDINFHPSWLNLTINDVADVVAGGTPKAGDPKNFEEPGKGIAWLTPADLSGYKNKYINHGARDLSAIGYSSSSAKKMPAGSLLFSSRAPIGYVAIASNEISTNQGFKNFVFPFGVDSSFAYYFLKSIRDLAESLGTGTTFKEISGSTAKTLPFPLPPIAEQKVIADKLDTLLVQVDNTKARLERIPEILKSFRQSVLAAAVSGKLTNSDTLAWVTHSVDDLAKVVNGKAFPSEDYQEKGIRLLRPGNLHMSGAVIWNAKNTTFIPESWVIKRPELILRDGALLMNLTAQSLADEFLGRVCIFSEQKEVTLLNQRICSFESKLDYDIKPYLFFVFKSPQFRSFVDTLDSGTLIKHLNVKDIKNYTLQLPNELEQTEIVRRVEELFAYADRIEQAAQDALSRVNNLTQSILAKAFRGELTADWRAANLGLISGDNSAEVLLAKIKTEREAIKNQPKPKPSTIKRKTGSPMSKQVIKVVDALREAGEPLSGQQLLAAAGYPSDSNTEQLERFFLDIREALTSEKSIVNLKRTDDGQDWFALVDTMKPNNT